MEDKIKQNFERRQFTKLRALHDMENNRLLQMKYEYSRLPEGEILIPYRYEAELFINGNRYYPDFMILLPDGSILIWEHFGMMDDIDYASRAWRKIENYRRAGYVQHTNLICTYESDIENGKVIDEIIRRFIL